ncbi:MAG: tRNA preQ1(34) S-adenosylmethionine ribosyltransferase-isomerase QueA [Syntrophaceae bacterium]|nr:tRNA preQ1(34) S-adenosylmethionine ribosyltransferase-isomerase QueA [Syntrophaceae bacterium]
MKLKDFSYHLPEELIAQHPSAQRDASRLLVLNKKEGEITDNFFSSLPDFLMPGDVLVINDSKVIPARLFGKKQTGANVEILLLAKKNGTEKNQTWEVLLKPAKRIRINDVISVEDNCAAKVIDRISVKKWLLEFNAPSGWENFINRFGQAPLPPYIRRKKAPTQNNDDKERYQTIYARNPGSVAAPTAGLHFSKSVLQALQAKNIRIAPITLHVGAGTFMPIETETVEEHAMEKEFYEISASSADLINNARRIVAVGTTSTRTLESATNSKGQVETRSGFTNLFIYPGYKFKKVEALITNFHLPESSLFLLVCAFAGKDFIDKAYNHAIENAYRFYSYGDCMLIT